MSVRHLLTSLLALRAEEFSDSYSRTLLVLSSCVPRGPMTPTQRGREGQEVIMGGVSYPLGSSAEAVYLSHTEGFH